jgi:hypothetical protein
MEAKVFLEFKSMLKSIHGLLYLHEFNYFRAFIIHFCLSWQGEKLMLLENYLWLWRVDVKSCFKQ